MIMKITDHTSNKIKAFLEKYYKKVRGIIELNDKIEHVKCTDPNEV